MDEAERIDGVRTVDRFAIVLPITQLAKSLELKSQMVHIRV